MSNTFIAWNDRELAEKAYSFLSKEFSGDTFIIGGEGKETEFIGPGVIQEINSCDSAVVIMAYNENNYVIKDKKIKIYFSPNTFMEIGYIRAKISFKNILYFFIDIPVETLPTDTQGLKVTLTDKKNFLKKLEMEYAKISNDMDNLFFIFNSWWENKAKLADTINKAMINEELLCKYLIHSIQPAYYFDELDTLKDLVNFIKTDNKNVIIAVDIVKLAVKSYQREECEKFFEEKIEYYDDWSHIIGHNFLALRQMKEYEKTKQKELLDKAERNMNDCIKTIDAFKPSYPSMAYTYITLWKGYLYYDYARVLILKNINNSEDIINNIQKAIECREKACKFYSGLSIDLRHLLMELTLRKGIIGCKAAFYKYKYDIKDMTKEEFRKEISLLSDLENKLSNRELTKINKLLEQLDKID